MNGMRSGRKHVPDPDNIEILHQRYQQQAGWTAAIRRYLISQCTLPEHPRTLEVGCGTGVILNEIHQLIPNTQSFGIDIDPLAVRYAVKTFYNNAYAQSDAVSLPFQSNSFDLVFCHFLLLWAKPVNGILKEVNRVLKPDAPFIAFAEPDYGGRIDFPLELSKLGEWQEQSLQQHGAQTRIGRELAHHLLGAEYTQVRTGVLGGEWDASSLDTAEIETLQRDLRQIKNCNSEEFESLLHLERIAQKTGSRTLFVPTFYAIGFKNNSCN